MLHSTFQKAFVRLSSFGALLMCSSLGLSNEPLNGAGAIAEVEPIQTAPTDWPWWRGLQHDGIASADQNPPVKWSDSENIIWSAPVPGRSHGSPIVVGDQVVLTAADHDRKLQSVLCFDRKTGKQIWETVVHEGGLDIKNNEKSSMASASAACDGKRIFVNFLNGDSVFMTALDRNGEKIWQTKLTSYINHQGFGSSPLLYKDLVIGVSDNKGVRK